MVQWFNESTPRRLSRSASNSPRPKLAFHFPGVSIGIERFAHPVERVRCYLRESPPGWSSVGTGANLYDVPAGSPSGLFLEVAGDRIDPADQPGLERRTPDAKRGAIHVVVFSGFVIALGALRHDPHILDCAALQHPAGVDLAFEAAARDVDCLIVQDIKVPASDQPAVEIGRFGNFRRPAGSAKNRVKVLQLN